MAMMSETNEGWFLGRDTLHHIIGVRGEAPKTRDVFYKFNVEFVTEIEIKTRILKTYCLVIDAR